MTPLGRENGRLMLYPDGALLSHAEREVGASRSVHSRSGSFTLAWPGATLIPADDRCEGCGPERTRLPGPRAIHSTPSVLATSTTSRELTERFGSRSSV